MRPIKILGLSALVALMAMAVVGASLAAAESTVLCLEDPGEAENPVCPPPSQQITHVHEATSEGNKAKLLTNVLPIECDVLFLGDVTSENNPGEPLEVSGNFTYTSCGSCTVTEVNGPAQIEVSKLGHELTDVTYKHEVHVECGALINCTHNGEGLLGHALGPLLSTETNGEVRLEEQALTKVPGGPLCPKKAVLDFLATPLSATYIAE